MQIQKTKTMLATTILFVFGMVAQAPVVANAELALSSGKIAPSAKPSAVPSKLRSEVKELEKLPKDLLQSKAGKGEVLSAVALANQFADEAQALANIPVLANHAAEDAARWYSLAAQMGALQSQSLSNISYKPLRAARSIRR